MPYASDAQRRYFHANKEELEAQGVDVDEWDRASKGKKLPERKKPVKKASVLFAVLARNNEKHAAEYDSEAFLRSLDNPEPAPKPAASAEPVLSAEDAKLIEQARREHDPALRAIKDRGIAEREQAEASQRSFYAPNAADVQLRDNYEAAKKRGQWTGITEQQYNDAQRRIAAAQLRSNASFSQAAQAVAQQPPAQPANSPIGKPPTASTAAWPRAAISHVGRGLEQMWGGAKNIGREVWKNVQPQQAANKASPSVAAAKTTEPTSVVK